MASGSEAVDPQYWEETASSGLGGGNAPNPAEAVMELDEHLDQGERTPEQEALDVLLEGQDEENLEPPYDFQSVGESPEGPLQADPPMVLATGCATE